MWGRGSGRAGGRLAGPPTRTPHTHNTLTHPPTHPPSPHPPPAPPCRVQVRAFGLTQYDAVLLVDPETTFTGDVAPLLRLPTDFAAAWDQVGGGLVRACVCVCVWAGG